MIDRGDIYAHDKLCKARFTYRAEKGDQWRSFADKVINGERWEGDCDDLASTALAHYIAASEDADLSRLFRLCVKTSQCPPNAPYDHMVAGALTDEGEFLIFGDTMCPPHPIHRSPHKIMRYARLLEGVVWREGSPISF